MTLEDYLVQSQPLQCIFLLALMAGAAVVFGLLVWRNVRLKQAEAAIKSPRTDAEAVGAVARTLTDLGISGSEIEQRMALVQATNSATKQAVAAAFDGMFEEVEKKEKEQYLAVFRGLCGAARPAESGNRDT
jgi:hypothetical protein